MKNYSYGIRTHNMKYETRIYLYEYMCTNDKLNGHSHLVRSSPVYFIAYTIARLSRPIKIYGIYEICCRVKCIRNNVIIPPRSHVINTWRKTPRV